MYRRTNDIIISGTIIGVCIVLILLIPYEIEKSMIGGLTAFPPYVFPLVVLSTIALLSAWWLIYSCISKKNSMSETVALFDKSILNVIITVIILVLGRLAISIVGFLVTSALMTGSLLIYFGVRKWKIILILTVAMPLFIYLFFEIIMKIPLPEAIIF